MSATITITIPAWLDFIFAWPVLLYRRLRYGYSFRKIYLGEGEYTTVEPVDYYRFSKFKWVLWGTGSNMYAVRNAKTKPLLTKLVYLHREIKKPGKHRLVDHRNNISLDNRSANLRHATYSQNVINRPKTKKKTSSKYLGVYWDKYRDKWGAAIRWQHKGGSTRKSLGRFKNQIDAARAYDVAALKYHKDFARTNFAREDYVKTRNGYKFAGETGRAKNHCSLSAEICKIYSSILGRLGTQNKKKGRTNYERDTVR
jgi:hypothetical protein